MKMNPEGLTLRDICTDIPPVRHAKYKNRDANELSVKLSVLDPLGRAGTTYAVAELTGRKWIGIELGDCDSIIERIKNIVDERKKLETYKNNLNTLFTDKDLANRHKHGLPLDNYQVSKEKILRALPQASSL